MTIGSQLKLAIPFGGFLRALFESQKLRSNFGRVAQQPEGKIELAAVTGLLPYLGVSGDMPEID